MKRVRLSHPRWRKGVDDDDASVLLIYPDGRVMAWFRDGSEREVSFGELMNELGTRLKRNDALKQAALDAFLAPIQ